ncbi:hypothetical protein BIW11_11717 [Tropilaelaps mercedesae]|uniref:PDZ domain-containing protein n=1 Tax=Tropilaelaps mercedesae TaxID=418985 RepID=A0A1V9X9S7_9ACAR|nr:hypothetical protein BIW11_11717 [Tropilaelaps mercedesae]
MSTMNVPLDALMGYVKLAITPSTSSLTCDVFERGTFRMVTPESPIVVDLLKDIPEVYITLRRDEKVKHFIKTRAVRVWDSTAGSFRTFHIVWWVSPEVQAIEGSSVMFGDLLMELNGVTCAELNQHQVAAMLAAAGTQIHIMVVETSVLHRLDLKEIDISIKRTKTKQFERRKGGTKSSVFSSPAKHPKNSSKRQGFKMSTLKTNICNSLKRLGHGLNLRKSPSEEKIKEL